LDRNKGLRASGKRSSPGKEDNTTEGKTGETALSEKNREDCVTVECGGTFQVELMRVKMGKIPPELTRKRPARSSTKSESRWRYGPEKKTSHFHTNRRWT